MTGAPWMALSTLAASTMWSISSITTLSMTAAASVLWPAWMEYSAHRYGGMVACSSSMAVCSASRS